MCQSTVLRGALHAVSHQGVLEDRRLAGFTPLPALRYAKQGGKGNPQRRHFVHIQGVKAKASVASEWPSES